MFQKIANILSIVSFVMVASMSGGAYLGYKYVTSEQFKNKLLNEVMGSVGKPMQKMLDSKMPEMTSPHVPLPYKLK